MTVNTTQRRGPARPGEPSRETLRQLLASRAAGHPYHPNCERRQVAQLRAITPQVGQWMAERLISDSRPDTYGDLIVGVLGLFADLVSPEPPSQPPPQRLSPRHRQVLTGVAEGLDNKDIAVRLFLTENTVKSHVRAVLVRLGAKNRAHAVAIALREGLI